MGDNWLGATKACRNRAVSAGIVNRGARCAGIGDGFSNEPERMFPASVTGICHPLGLPSVGGAVIGTAVLEQIGTI